MRSYHKGEHGTDKGDWFMFDTALAVQNLALAAHELELHKVQVYRVRIRGRVNNNPVFG
jgi:nitroreductase